MSAEAKVRRRVCALCHREERPGLPCTTPVTALLRHWGITEGSYAHPKCIDRERARRKGWLEKGQVIQ